MKIDIKGILQGINNSIFVKEEVEKIAEARTAICKACPYYSANVDGANNIRKDKFCTKCSCNIYLKSRALSAFCPMHYWESLSDDKTAEQLQDTPDLKQSLIDYKIKLAQNKTE